MRVKYGPVDLGDDVLTSEITSEVVYDDGSGLEPMMRKLTLAVSVAVNTATLNLSHDPLIQGNLVGGQQDAWGQVIPVVQANPLPQQTADPITTNFWLQKVLLTPRLRLEVYDFADLNDPPPGGAVNPNNSAQKRWMVISPPEGEKVDVGGGPLPVACTVRAVMGAPATVLVEWVVETFVPYRGYSTTDPSDLLLDSSFRMSHSLDERYGVTRDVVGTAVFRSDALERWSLNPDSYRANLLLPCPRGWRRSGVTVSLAEDGRTYNFAFRDVQLDTNLNDVGAGAAYVEAEMTSALYKRNDLIEGTLNVINSHYALKSARYFADQDAKKDGEPKDALDPAMLLKFFGNMKQPPVKVVPPPKLGGK